MAREKSDGVVKRRAGIQSVEIGWRVLEALASLGRPSALSAVVQACGMSPSQTHRYLASMIVAGMARQDDNGRYDLGPAALRLGLGVLARTDVFRTADMAISKYTEAHGRTVLLAALGPMGPTVIRWHAGWPLIVTSITVGSVLPLLRSATGNVFVGFGTDQELRSLIDRETQEASELVPVDIEDIRKRVRSGGRGRVEGTFLPGLRAVAFPIFDLQGKVALVATMVSSAVFTHDKDAEAADALDAVCRQITSDIGGATPG